MSSDEPSKPPRRRWRTIVIAAGTVFILVVAVLASTLLFREDLAQAILRDQLNELGLKESRFRVENFTPGTISITGFSAGGSVSFDRLTVTFSASEILRGRLARIDLTGLRLDLTQPRPWASAGGTSDGKSGGESADRTGLPLDPSDLPTINIEQARIRLAGPAGPADVTATAHLQPDRNGVLALRAEASMMGPPGMIDLVYDGSIRAGTKGTARAEGRLSATSASLTLDKATLKSLKIDLPLAVDLTANGAATLTAKDFRLRMDRVELAPSLGAGPIDVTLSGRLTSTSSSGGRVEASADVAIDCRAIRASDLTAKRLTSALSMQVQADTKTATLDIARDSRLSLDGVRLAGDKSVTKLSTLLSGQVTLSWPAEKDTAGPAIDHKLSIIPSPVTLSGPPEFHAIPGNMEAIGHLAADRAYQGRIRMDAGHFIHGRRSFALSSLTAHLTTKASLERPNAAITIKGLHDMSAATVAGKPLGGSYDLTATVQGSGNRLAYRAEIGGLGLSKLVAIDGGHDLATRTGHADVTLSPIALGPAGVPPASVIPALGAIRNVAGVIGGGARLNWSGRGFDGRATLRLDGIGGETDDGSFDGISGVIVIDHLMPPSTAREQVLRIRKVDAGTVLTDIVIRFTLLPTGILRIGRAEATVAGGKIIVVAPVVDLAAETAQATATVQGIHLAQILKLIDSSDLQATGEIHGYVPFRIADGKVAIDAGALAALGGGTLRFKSERARQILASGGEQVSLMLQALEDFTYERLGIDIDKGIAGNARVALRTLGHNPSVLQGRKFQINVNLVTNLDRILDAVVEWYRLSGRAWRDIVAHGRRTRNPKQ